MKNAIIYKNSTFMIVDENNQASVLNQTGLSEVENFTIPTNFTGIIYLTDYENNKSMILEIGSPSVVDQTE